VLILTFITLEYELYIILINGDNYFILFSMSFNYNKDESLHVKTTRQELRLEQLSCNANYSLLISAIFDYLIFTEGRKRFHNSMISSFFFNNHIISPVLDKTGNRTKLETTVIF